MGRPDSASLVLAPTLADWQLVSLPRPLFLLYYVVRPFRLAAKYAQRLLGKVLSR